jgi:hypothetical protein
MWQILKERRILKNKKQLIWNTLQQKFYLEHFATETLSGTLCNRNFIWNTLQQKFYLEHFATETLFGTLCNRNFA